MVSNALIGWWAASAGMPLQKVQFIIPVCHMGDIPSTKCNQYLAESC
jgi:hypothetical protein